MSAESLEAYLREHIPLSRAMGVRAVAMDGEGLTLTAPLEPNLNHRDTLFGGSASALCTLACWGLCHRRLREETDLDVHLVIQRNEMEYLEPARGDVRAVCPHPRPGRWERFVETVRRKGKGRIRLEATLYQGETPVGRFQGMFVALVPDGTEDAPGR